MTMSTRGLAALALACLTIAACTPAERRAERPESVTTPGLDTGITSNNGGGQKALNNNVGVSTPPVQAR